MSKIVQPAGIRTFIAVPVPGPVRKSISLIQTSLPSPDSQVSWVRSDLFHITMRFLGNLTSLRLREVEQSVRTVAAGVSAFDLSLGGIGAFPSRSLPRVIWVGLAATVGLQQLQNFQRSLNENLVSRSFPPEDQPFHPHVTIGRTRDSISPGTRRQFGQSLQQEALANELCSTFTVNEILVMRSDSGASGVRYTSTYRAALAGHAGDREVGPGKGDMGK